MSRFQWSTVTVVVVRTPPDMDPQQALRGIGSVYAATISAPPADPTLFAASTEEQQRFLLMHKDIIVLSPQEQARYKYASIKSAYLSLPQIVRFIVAVIAVILFLVIVPVLLVCAYKVFMLRKVELASIALTLLAVHYAWRLWIQDL